MRAPHAFLFIIWFLACSVFVCTWWWSQLACKCARIRLASAVCLMFHETECILEGLIDAIFPPGYPSQQAGPYLLCRRNIFLIRRDFKRTASHSVKYLAQRRYRRSSRTPFIKAYTKRAWGHAPSKVALSNFVVVCLRQQILCDTVVVAMADVFLSLK